MITAPAEYLTRLRHSHTSIIRVTAYEGSTEIGELDLVDLTMTLDSKADIQRTADLTVAVDPYRSESRDVLEAVTTTKGLIKIEHAIGVGDYVVGDYVTLGTLRVEESEDSPTRAVRKLRAYDRTLLLQEYVLPTARPLNDTYWNLIQDLVFETTGEYPSRHAAISTITAPAPGKSFNRGDNRLRRIQELAEAIDAWLICLPDGSFHLDVAPGTTSANGQDVQWAFDQGDEGVLINTVGTYSRREQYNAVGIEFTPADPDDDWASFIFLWDNDPNSPTYFDGDFGKKPIMFTEEYDHLPSVTEAEAVARRKLYEHSGVTRAIRVTGIYNPLLLPGDKVTIDMKQPDDTFAAETHFIERIDLRLGSSAAMDVDTRMARLPGSTAYSVNGA